MWVGARAVTAVAGTSRQCAETGASAGIAGTGATAQRAAADTGGLRRIISLLAQLFTASVGDGVDSAPVDVVAQELEASGFEWPPEASRGRAAWLERVLHDAQDLPCAALPVRGEVLSYMVRDGTVHLL